MDLIIYNKAIVKRSLTHVIIIVIIIIILIIITIIMWQLENIEI